jgi:hypothetical protein
MAVDCGSSWGEPPVRRQALRKGGGVRTSRAVSLSLRSVRLWSLAVLLVVTGGTLVGGAPAATPGAGAPSKPAAGLLMGKLFVTRAAIVERDFYGDVNIYLFTRPRGCGTVSAMDRPYVWMSVAGGGRALEPGATMVSANGVRVAANVAYGARTTVLRRKVSIRLTHVGRAISSVWRGSLRIVSPAGGGVTTVFGGAFAARWCGKV